MDYASRQQRVRVALRKQGFDALLITHLPNVRYLCGFTGSAGVLAITKRAGAFFTDGRYTQQAKDEVAGAKVVAGQGSAQQLAIEWLREGGVKTLGLEAEHISIAQHAGIRNLARGMKLAPVSGLVEGLRVVKEVNEVRQIEKAVRLASGLFDALTGSIHPGITEAEVAAGLEYAARRAGAEAMSFESIVASGKRSALPHGRASKTRVGRGFVILDYGVILGGYCSDMTRTVHVGRPTTKSRAMYQAVLDAQLAAIDAVRAGVTAGEVDAAARRELDRAGLDQYFTHSTGHGVGLEIHEPPRLGKGQEQPLQAGMVVTIEPGVYVPAEGGVRIEDMVLVTGRGCKVLTPTPKEFMVL